jgi:LacI family transcriptional regulator
VTPQPPATLRDVADLAGVHPATASRALRDGTRHLVGDAAASRVLQAARDLGYVPNHAAASLRTQRTRTIGFLAASLDSPLTAPLAHGAAEELGRAGYMMLAATGPGAAAEASLRGMTARRADGLIIASPVPCPRLQALAARAGIPAVAAGHSPAGISSAAADLAAGARLAASHLAALGHRHAACLASPDSPPSAGLLAGAARGAGLAVEQRHALTARGNTAADGQGACGQLLASGELVTAVIAGSVLLAAGCLAALAAARCPCPQAVSVTGLGDLPLADCLAPALTAVSLPQDRAGAAAARLLLETLRRPGATPRAVLLRPALVPRRSTAPPTAARPGFRATENS